MSKRLQVVLEDEEYEEIQRVAGRHGIRVSAWVCDTLRHAMYSEQTVETGRKLEIIRAAARHEFPTADIEQMLAQIDRGRFARFSPYPWRSSLPEVETLNRGAKSPITSSPESTSRSLSPRLEKVPV